eukprot:CAMPEP_0202437158 /NCGR_PEP_ID=MMETSP1345-20130828/28096_1 /ASSEMBLY_ACC=CAM_ASM_000843 /TAXON_ID=342563 /ORGANISM="Fabrea Fabrea salina" /LENGTH=51 /DNA_ID=CAMNT_0049050813 /DNA_START=75 /DNA_END=227 /DNA_ORIENTATION=-
MRWLASPSSIASWKEERDRDLKPLAPTLPSPFFGDLSFALIFSHSSLLNPS